MRTLLVDGQIYSLSESFATAILIENGLIAWIGSEGGADVHRREVDSVVELDGDLITPGFVNLASDHLNAAGGFVHAQTAPCTIADGWPKSTWQAHADEPLAVVPRDPCELRSRIAAGRATALAPAHQSDSGWLTIRAAVHEVAEEQRLTARAAFAALTRGAWRLLGHPDRGVLAVGADATFVRWRVRGLVVESPDQRISNWSTDPRSAVPGLPPLEPGQPLPTWVQTWRDGMPC